MMHGDRGHGIIRHIDRGSTLGNPTKGGLSMAERTEQRGELATELPSRYLPAVPYRDLPEARSLRNYMGASVIILATALGSGELILWPYITTQVGISLVWLSVLGAILPNTIPGWAASGAELFTFIFGLGAGAAPIVATIFLISIALALTLSPVVYQVLEKVQAVMVIIILAFIALG